MSRTSANFPSLPLELDDSLGLAYLACNSGGAALFVVDDGCREEAENERVFRKASRWEEFQELRIKVVAASETSPHYHYQVSLLKHPVLDEKALRDISGSKSP